MDHCYQEVKCYKHIYFTLGRRLAEIVAKFRLSDVIKSVCEDEELQPIECEKHGSCKNCPHYKPVKQTVL